MIKGKTFPEAVFNLPESSNTLIIFDFRHIFVYENLFKYGKDWIISMTLVVDDGESDWIEINPTDEMPRVFNN